MMEEGDMVVVTRSGRVGILVDLHRQTNKGLVQFGPSGPSAELSIASIRRATAEDIFDAGLVGVGCNQQDEVSVYLRSLR